MNKNFDSWNNLKKTIHHNKKTIGFSQYEIIFMKIGTNIGYEQDGTTFTLFDFSITA
jgi:hypothetical protein